MANSYNLAPAPPARALCSGADKVRLYTDSLFADITADKADELARELLAAATVARDLEKEKAYKPGSVFETKYDWFIVSGEEDRDGEYKVVRLPKDRSVGVVTPTYAPLSYYREHQSLNPVAAPWDRNENLVINPTLPAGN